MTDPTGRAALRNGTLFAEATDDDLGAVLGVAEEVSFEAGQVIFEQGDNREGMFVVLEGEAQVDVGGRFHRLRAGDFFGEMALLVPDKRLADVRAVERVRALRISSEAFESFLLDHPRIAVGMLRALSSRLREVEQRIDAWMAP
ncbi:MAG TPA: cyclic nucleotide-binding domain-containing protein [Actinomycetota bacterium]|jgi:CRP-like cAMP-binding protein|nr:cyclic nucleotide-binding domain-containing protein [Actinomycetota bacterium]